jgi:hypothetical protein
VILFLGFSSSGFKGARKVLLCCSNSGRKKAALDLSTGMKNVEILVRTRFRTRNSN